MTHQHNFTVLVVDDEYIYRDELVLACEGAGFRVREATDFDEALQRLTQETFGAAVVDLMLPPGYNREGLDICVRLKEREIPFVVVTNRAEREVLAEVAKLEPLAIFSKLGLSVVDLVGLLKRAKDESHV